MRRAKLISEEESSPQRQGNRNREAVLRARRQARRRLAAPQSTPGRDPMVGKMPKPTMESGDNVPKVLKENWETITGIRATLDLVDGVPDNPPQMKGKPGDYLSTEKDPKQPTEQSLTRKAPEYDMDGVEKLPRFHERENVKQATQPTMIRHANPAEVPEEREIVRQPTLEEQEPMQPSFEEQEPEEQIDTSLLQTAQKIVDVKIAMGEINEDQRWDEAFKLAKEYSGDVLNVILLDHNKMSGLLQKNAGRSFSPPRVSGVAQPTDDPGITTDEAIFGA